MFQQANTLNYFKAPWSASLPAPGEGKVKAALSLEAFLQDKCG